MLVVDFLLEITEVFLLDITVEALRANIDWKLSFSQRRGQFDPIFQVEGVVPQQPFFVSEN